MILVALPTPGQIRQSLSPSAGNHQLATFTWPDDLNLNLNSQFTIIPSPKFLFFGIHVDRPPVNPTNKLLLRTLPFFSISDSLTHNINLFSKLLFPISKCHNIVMFIYLYQNSKLKHSIFFLRKTQKSFLLFRRTYHRLRK